MHVADDALGAAVVTAGEAAAILARVDADVRRLDDEIRASAAGKVFRRAWRRFVTSWRVFFSEEASRPSRGAARAAMMYANEARDWRQAFKRELAARVSGPDADLGAAAALSTPGTLRHEAEAVQADIAALDAEIAAGVASDRFRRAWGEFLLGWRALHAQVIAAREADPATSARLAEYRRRTALWAEGLAREQIAARLNGERADMGALIVTPGAIKDEMETVNAGVKQLDSDIMSSKVRDGFKKAWRLFATEWQRFYASKQGWWSRSWGSTWEKTVDYRKRVDEWRAAFQREGGQSTGPTLVVPQKPGSSSFKWWLVGGLLVGGAVLGAKALR